MEGMLPSTSGREFAETQRRLDWSPKPFTSSRHAKRQQRWLTQALQSSCHSLTNPQGPGHFLRQPTPTTGTQGHRKPLSRAATDSTSQNVAHAKPIGYAQEWPEQRVLGSLCTANQVSITLSAQDQVLAALENVIDPDFGASIVACQFVKDLIIDEQTGSVAFNLELTTPACPVKDQFQRQCEEYVGQLSWVTSVNVKFSAQQATPLMPESNRPSGLKGVSHVIAVSSCKGGVGKSTTAVNLAYTLAQMGARVGILDADVYGPSLPTMVSPNPAVLQMDPVTKQLTPAEYEGVKLVSFGFAGQGSAIMRGAMVSGLIEQLLTTTQWGELDYLIVDFPPGTGDIQLTLCQSAAFSAAVIVTTPQKLSFIDVAKGIRMFARLEVPCVAVVENMSFFEVDGVRHFPFGKGSGDRIVRDFGLQNLIHFPIVPDLSAAGDGGQPLVIAEPSGAVAAAFMELGSAVVREVSKLQAAPKNSLRFEKESSRLVLRTSDGKEAMLDPAFVRRNDTSATSINEWTGERQPAGGQFPDDIKPSNIQRVGNYAVLIMWEDGFNQVAPFSHLEHLARSSEASAEGSRNLQPDPELVMH